MSLPGPHPHMFGREQLFTDSLNLLRSGARLVTLTGPGGVGKTRLAWAIAAAASDDFEVGALFVPLETIRDSSLVMPTVAQALGLALGLREEANRRIADQLSAALGNKSLLLVLDNLEQQIDEASAILADLLGACPTLKVLATSRASLRLKLEHNVVVPPLTPPEQVFSSNDRVDKETLQELSQNPAVSLFVARVKMAGQESFNLTDTNAAAIAEICQRLDGLPLAIELAAARGRILPPEELLARLETQLPLLTGGGRELPDRQKTMRDAIAWSYDLLSNGEKQLFRQLSVFAGGFTLDAASKVALPDPTFGLSALDGIGSLVGNSLLQQPSLDAKTSRFRILEPIREFGLDQLRAAQEFDDAMGRYVCWCLRLAHEVSPKGFEGNSPNIFESNLFGKDAVEWERRVEIEYRNLRAALTWIFEWKGDEALAISLVGILSDYWYRCGYFSEGKTWLGKALSLLDDKGIELSEEQIKVLTGGCLMFQHVGDYDAAAVLGRRALEAAKRIGNLWAIGEANGVLGDLEQNYHNYPAAYAYQQEAASCFRNLGTIPWQATTEANSAIAALGQGNVEQAVIHAKEGRRLAAQVGEPWGVSFALRTLADVLGVRREFAEAACSLLEGLDFLIEQGLDRSTTRWELPKYFDRCAILASRLGEYHRAARLFGAARRAYEAVGAVHPTDTPGREAAESMVREKSGEQVESLWTTGESLSTEQAVAEAREVLTEGLAISDPRPTSSGQTRERFGPEASAAALTRRELEVLQLLANGFDNHKIAEAMFLSERTSYTHIRNILQKLSQFGVHSQAQAVAWAYQNSIVSEHNPTHNERGGTLSG